MKKFLFWALFALLPAVASAQATIIPNPSGGGGGGGSVTGGACSANMVATSNNSQAVPGCVTVTSAYVDTSIAKTGGDINTSNNVTSLHMAAPVHVDQGGTGLGSYTGGDILYAVALNVIGKLNDVGVGNVLLSGGVSTAPAYGKVTLTGHVSGILPSANGGTNNAFVNISGPTASTKTYTLPDASATLLTTNAAVTVAQGGSGQTNLAAHCTPVGNGTSPIGCISPGAAGTAWISNGASADPSWQAVSGTGTVTQIAFNGPLSGGTVTSTGTVGCATCVTAASALSANGVVLGAGSQGTRIATANTAGYVFTDGGPGVDGSFQPPTTSVAEGTISGSLVMDATYLGKSFEVNCTGCSITLPPVSGHPGQSIAFTLLDTSGLATIVSAETTNINGQHTRVMWGGETANLLINSAGTGWKKVSGQSIPMVCEINNSALQTINAYAGASTKVNLNTVVIDNTTLMADTTNHVCKILRPSTYFVLGQMGWNNMGPSQDVLGTTGKNGNGDQNRVGQAEMNQPGTGVYLKAQFSNDNVGAINDTYELDVITYSQWDLQAGQNFILVREVPTW